MKAQGLAAAMGLLCVAGILATTSPARAQCVPDPPVGSRSSIACFSSVVVAPEPTQAAAVPMQVLAGYPLSFTAGAWLPTFAGRTPWLRWSPVATPVRRLASRSNAGVRRTGR